MQKFYKTFTNGEKIDGELIAEYKGHSVVKCEYNAFIIVGEYYKRFPVWQFDDLDMEDFKNAVDRWELKRYRVYYSYGRSTPANILAEAEKRLEEHNNLEFATLEEVCEFLKTAPEPFKDIGVNTLDLRGYTMSATSVEGLREKILFELKKGAKK